MTVGRAARVSRLFFLLQVAPQRSVLCSFARLAYSRGRRYRGLVFLDAALD